MSDPVVISQILLWIAVLCLGTLCLALARQIGVLHERIAPAGALSVNQRLKAGSKAPIVTVSDLNGESFKIGEQNLAGKSTILFFASPDCPICKKLLPIVKSSINAESSWVRGFIASDGGKVQAHEKLRTQYQLDKIPYILSEELGRSYGVSKLPYAVLIDEKGVIASLGMVNSREHIESLFEAKERGVSSIQEFIQRKNLKNEA